MIVIIATGPCYSLTHTHTHTGLDFYVQGVLGIFFLHAGGGGLVYVDR